MWTPGRTTWQHSCCPARTPVSICEQYVGSQYLWMFVLIPRGMYKGGDCLCPHWLTPCGLWAPSLATWYNCYDTNLPCKWASSCAAQLQMGIKHRNEARNVTVSPTLSYGTLAHATQLLLMAYCRRTQAVLLVDD